MKLLGELVRAIETPPVTSDVDWTTLSDRLPVDAALSSGLRSAGEPLSEASRVFLEQAEADDSVLKLKVRCGTSVALSSQDIRLPTIRTSPTSRDTFYAIRTLDVAESAALFAACRRLGHSLTVVLNAIVAVAIAQTVERYGDGDLDGCTAVLVEPWDMRRWLEADDAERITQSVIGRPTRLPASLALAAGASFTSPAFAELCALSATNMRRVGDPHELECDDERVAHGLGGNTHGAVEGHVFPSSLGVLDARIGPLPNGVVIQRPIILGVNLAPQGVLSSQTYAGKFTVRVAARWRS